jgi:hypothetical protein
MRKFKRYTKNPHLADFGTEAAFLALVAVAMGNK